MKATKSAVRYAKALLELAIEQNKIDQVSADMSAFLSAYNETRDFQLFLSSPVIKADKKIEILSSVFTNFDELTSKFIRLIVKNRREAALAQIAEAYNSELMIFKGIVPVTLISASSLDKKTKDSIIAKITPVVKGTLQISEQIDPSLIGGFIVKMGDTRIDASVANKIKNLKVNLTK